MLRSLYELEKRNKAIYDNVHEYCLAEKVNEEQLRISIKKKYWFNNPIKMCKFIGNLLVQCKGDY
jgi:hypothetical protein